MIESLRDSCGLPGLSFHFEYLTYMTTTVSSKGQVVLPAELREQDRIRPGQRFSIERLDAGKYLLKRLPVAEKSGVTDWLLACPEKGWFQPLPSESTDTLRSM
jgi:AbrB family looped-hinge helix DNA binding protein